MDRSKILIVTSSFDYTVDYIIAKYSNVNFYRINVDLFSQYQFLIGNNGWSVKSESGEVDIHQIKSIYYRKPILPDLKDFSLCHQGMIGRDIIGLIEGLVNSFDGIVLTKPFLLKKAENKIYQLLVLQKLHVPFPLSLIGNTVDMDRHLPQCPKIIKPLSQGKIDLGKEFEFFQTNVLIKSVGDISLTPIYIQESIPKAFEMRITCLDNWFWPVRIYSSDATDWRHPNAINSYSSVEIPNHIKKMCIAILNELNLRFGAFDFIVNPSGEWIFLEVNPNGQWLWLEQILNLNISEKIVAALGGI